jgi:hypothetical protein
MDATPGPTPPSRPRPALAPAGELVIDNGRLKGTRRALGVPLTCIGQGPACDLRLNVDGVSPLHCLIVHSPGGFVVRDMGGAGGTLLNGMPVTTAPLRDGDLLTVGPFQMKACLPRLATPPQGAAVKGSPVPAALELAAEKEALRIQVAAVVAQQTALGEEEARLAQRRATLEQQEAQLAAHLEEKRRRLVELRTQVQSARVALKHDQEAYKRHVEKVTGDLSQAERDLLERRQQAEAERRRALSLQRRLRERYSRNLRAERTALHKRERQLEGSTRALETTAEKLRQEQAALAQACLRFNGEVEVRRRQLQDEWDKLHRAQKAWQEQRREEEADLGGWQADLEQREAELAEGQQALRRERAHWQGARLSLEKEVAGLENRIRNQRRKVTEKEQEIQRLEGVRRGLTAEPDGATAAAPPNVAADSPTAQALAIAHQEPRGPAAIEEKTAPEAEAGLQLHRAALEGLAGELADQRLQLVEQWEMLTRTRAAWRQEHESAAAELKLLAARLQEQGQAFLAREQELTEGAGELRRRHEEMAQVRQHLLGWQARLRARELAWEAERERLVADLRGREELAERHLASVADLRQRWAKRRRRELELLQQERVACEKVRMQYVNLREERRQRQRELDEERSQLTARMLALEQHHREMLSKAGDAAAAERRIERLRRRWLTENAAALRALKREREALQAEVAQIEDRHAELQKRAEQLSADSGTLADSQAGWEQQQAQHEAEQARLQNDLARLQGQLDRSRQEGEELRGEVERIARQLLDEPEVPALLLEQAA